ETTAAAIADDDRPRPLRGAHQDRTRRTEGSLAIDGDTGCDISSQIARRSHCGFGVVLRLLGERPRDLGQGSSHPPVVRADDLQAVTTTGGFVRRPRNGGATRLGAIDTDDNHGGFHGSPPLPASFPEGAPGTGVAGRAAVTKQEGRW